MIISLYNGVRHKYIRWIATYDVLGTADRDYNLNMIHVQVV